MRTLLVAAFGIALAGIARVEAQSRDATWRPAESGIEYPAIMLKWRRESYVDLMFDIDARGRVDTTSIVVVQPPEYPMFLPAAKKALREGQSTPAIDRGRPVRQTVRHRFVFALDNQPFCIRNLLPIGRDVTLICAPSRP